MLNDRYLEGKDEDGDASPTVEAVTPAPAAATAATAEEEAAAEAIKDLERRLESVETRNFQSGSHIYFRTFVFRDIGSTVLGKRVYTAELAYDRLRPLWVVEKSIIRGVNVKGIKT